MSSYYDVDAILTDSQKVPVTFEIDVPGLGYLNGNVGGDIKAGTKVELPLWLGEMLAVSQPSGTSALATPLRLSHPLARTTHAPSACIPTFPAPANRPDRLRRSAQSIRKHSPLDDTTHKYN